MSRTKIVATIGPASAQAETIRGMLRAGMSVARMNFSHGDHAWHRATVHLLRTIAQEENKVLAILGDLQGPKMRLGLMAEPGLPLSLGDEILLTSRQGQPGMIHLPHPELIAAIKPGARLVFGDGEVEVQVSAREPDLLRATVTVAGRLESHRGISAPGTNLPLSSITAKDREDLALICELEMDYVALSFVRTAADIHELRELMRQQQQELPIIAKIEKSEAIEHLEEIRDAAAGMMVARGDLGIDVPPQEVPLLQKRIIQACNEAGKPVITATQMLQSMVSHPRPTRAEASDVANAILDGTDAVMLSNETAAGEFPVASVEMMQQIATITEAAFPYESWQQRRLARLSEASRSRHPAPVAEAISSACCTVAESVKARGIVTSTLSGYTARQIARHRPATPIIAVTPLARTQRLLALVWGVRSEVGPMFDSTDRMLGESVAAVKALGLERGDKLVITAGIPFGQQGQTNLIQVHVIE